MLGPIVALLLLTSPAAGPAQYCYKLDYNTQAACLQQQRQQTQLDDQQRRIDTLERQAQPSAMDRLIQSTTSPNSTGSGSMYQSAGRAYCTMARELC